MKAKRPSFWRNVANGVRSGYPICCVVEYSLRVLLGGGPIAADVGCIRLGPAGAGVNVKYRGEWRKQVGSCEAGYVHCLVHRRSHLVRVWR